MLPANVPASVTHKRCRDGRGRRFDKGDYPLRPVACETWDGHIFINLSSAPRPLLEQVHGLPERFAPWGMQDLRMVHRIQYDVATNWKLVVQNYNECLHCPVIHPLLNRIAPLPRRRERALDRDLLRCAMGFKEGVETLSRDGKRRRAVLPGLGAREQELVNYLRSIPTSC